MSNDRTVDNGFISLGIDTISGFTRLREGYSRLIKNVTLNSAGWVEKRKGFQYRSGIVPLKIKRSEYRDSENLLVLDFDESVSLSDVPDTPITVYKKDPDPFDFDSDRAKSLYATPDKWRTLVSEKLTSDKTSFTYTNSTTGFNYYLVKDQTNTNINRQEVGGVLSYDQTTNQTTYSFDDYFTSYPNSTLEVIPVEVSEVSEGGGSYSPDVSDLTSQDLITTKNLIFSGTGFGFNFGFDDYSITIPPSRDNVSVSETQGEISVSTGDDRVTLKLPTSLMGLNSALMVTQCYTELNGIYELVYPESVVITRENNLEVTFVKDDRDLTEFISSIRIYARQPPVSNFIVRNISELTETITITGIQNEFNLYKVYLRNPSESSYEEVLVNEIYYNKETGEATLTLEPIDLGSLLIVWEKVDVVQNKIGIEISEEFDFTNGHVYGIPHKNNYTVSSTYGGRIAGLINRSDVGQQELVASLGGNFYTDKKASNNSAFRSKSLNSLIYIDDDGSTDFLFENNMDYYISSPSIRGVVSFKTGSSDLTYGKRFVKSVGVDDVGRSFNLLYKGNSIVDDDGFVEFPIDHVLYNKVSNQLIIDLSSSDFSFDKMADDDLNFYKELFSTYDSVVIKESGISNFDSEYKVASYDDDNKLLVIDLNYETNKTKLNDNFSLDTLSSLKFGCFTTTILLEDNTFSMGNLLDEGVFNNDQVTVYSISSYDSETKAVTFNNAGEARTIASGIAIAGKATTNELYFSSIYNIVYGDMLSVSGNAGNFKVVDVEILELKENDITTSIDAVALAKVTLDTNVFVTDSLLSNVSVTRVGRWCPIEQRRNASEKFQVLDQYEYSEQEPINLEVIKDVVLIDNYENTTKKYDGDSIYRAGLPNWRPIYNVSEVRDANNKIGVQKILPPRILLDIDGDSNDDDKERNVSVRSAIITLEGNVSWLTYIGRDFGFNTDEGALRFKLESAEIVNNSGEEPYVKLEFEGLTKAAFDDFFLRQIDSSNLWEWTYSNGYIGVPQSYNYMARLYATDAQGNKVISRNCGFGDYNVDQVFDAALGVSIKTPDEKLLQRSNGNWEIELLRTKKDAPNVYYFITSRKLNIDFSQEERRVSRLTILDAQSDSALLEGDIDGLSGFVSQGDTLATTIQGPARALHTTTSSNRYIQANVQSEEFADFIFAPDFTDPEYNPLDTRVDNQTLYMDFDSRMVGSSLTVSGTEQNEDGDPLEVVYTIKPQMLPSLNVNTDEGIYNATAKLINANINSKSYVGVEVVIPESSVPAGHELVAFTIHSPVINQNDFASNLYDKYYYLQGTHIADRVSSPDIDGNIEIDAYVSRRVAGESVSGEIDVFVTLHTVLKQDDKHEYFVNVPCYPPMFVEGERNISYKGQGWDRKSRSYVNQLGQLVKSQFTDVQEYIYHMQEVLDRLGNLKGLPYDVFPFFSSRSATDRFTFRLTPKDDEVLGYGFKWTAGKQCSLAYEGIIISESFTRYPFRKRVFPSRVLLSAPQYPEIFDNPYIENTTDNEQVLGSTSAIDINADDGQEITGVQTFLSESLFSAANLDSIVLVFKTNSVYALFLADKSVSLIETAGIGCTIPNSIQATSSGITFANEDGIYIITRNLQMQYLGKPLEGIWTDNVDTSIVNEVTSFNNTKKREFYLSVPTKDGNYVTLSYDYAFNGSLEQAVRQEGWTILDGFRPSTWTKTGSNFYYGGYEGLVMENRNAKNETDYRDDDKGINAVIEYAPTSFGDAGTRASLSRVISHFDYQTPITGLRLSVAVDASDTFTYCGTVNIQDNGKKTRSIKVRPVEDKGLYFQVKMEHSTIDETFRLTGITYKASVSDDEVFETADT